MQSIQFRMPKYVSVCFLLLSTPRPADANTLRVLVFFVSLREFVQKIFGEAEVGFGSCDGCFCIPKSGESCPVDRKPPTEFGSLIPVLRALTWENPYSLDCDPYANNSCDTTPAIGEGGACVVDFSGPEGTCPDNWSYSVSTYPRSFEEAQANSSLYVTHGGPCGLCSSLQDLSVYMEIGAGLQEKVVGCGIPARQSKSDGIACFQDIGFTQGCSVLWYYNLKNTEEECLAPCATASLLNLPSNGPPPQSAMRADAVCELR